MTDSLLRFMQLVVEVISTKIANPLTHYSTYPKTLELLHDRAINDPDEQLQEWAQEQLKNFT
jgi:uncharacterized protein (DUF2062 family)